MSGFAGKAISGWNVSGITIAQSGDPLTFIAATNGTNPAAETGLAYGTSTTQYLTGVSTAQFCSGFGPKNVFTTGPINSRVGTHAPNGVGYINTAAFCPANIVPFGQQPTVVNGVVTDPGATDFGNSGVGQVLGPGQFNWDISILKNTKLTEKINMQFRTDFYNAFNHAQFADPGGGSFATVGFENVAEPSTIQVQHTSVNPRLIQFGVHFTF
jgi:hypothetical protein